MNGFSDVRLFLSRQELDQHGQPAMRLRTPAHLSGLGLMLHRWRSRRDLLELDAEQLRDIGLDRSQARAEALKPFWRP